MRERGRRERVERMREIVREREKGEGRKNERE